MKIVILTYYSSILILPKIEFMNLMSDFKQFYSELIFNLVNWIKFEGDSPHYETIHKLRDTFFCKFQTLKPFTIKFKFCDNLP